MTQTIEQLQARVRELEEENARLKTVPMRYRRMQFNAELQDENAALRQQLQSAQEENNTLRRIHKENIDILVKELSNKDYEHNQKTKRLIERHAEQIRRCNDEVNRRRYNSDSELPNDYEVN